MIQRQQKQVVLEIWVDISKASHNMASSSHTQSLILNIIIGKMIFCNQALASLKSIMVVGDAYFLPYIDGMFFHFHADSSRLNSKYFALTKQHPVDISTPPYLIPFLNVHFRVRSHYHR